MMKPFFCAVMIVVLASFGWASEKKTDSGAKSPLVKVGDTLPAMTFKDSTGKTVDLQAALKTAPAVLVYYRGGWCPFCNKHLSTLQKALPELKKRGYVLYGVSPDKPEKLAASVGKLKLDYALLSDSTMANAKALGITFRLPDKTFSLYKNKYNIDIEAASGETHHLLPVPTVVVAGQDGKVKYVYSNEDYKVRLDNQALLNAID